MKKIPGVEIRFNPKSAAHCPGYGHRQPSARPDNRRSGSNCLFSALPMACSTLTLQKEERLAWFEETTSEDDRRGGL